LTLENIYTQVQGASRVQNALEKIHEGYLNKHSIEQLAQSVFVSERQLRKLFVKHLGLAPIKIAKYHKALFAKKLVVFSRHSLTEIAFASGFNSIRQFNSVFKEVFGYSPSVIRRSILMPNLATAPVFLLKYAPPFHFKNLLSFLKIRAITGVEEVTDQAYSRTFRTDEARGFFIIRDCPAESALQLQIHTDDIRCYMMIYHQVRKMFDLDMDFSNVIQQFKKDVILNKGLEKNQVPRLPIAFNPFEGVIRAIIGQHSATTTLISRLVEKTDLRTDDNFPEGLRYFFPTPAELLSVEIEGLAQSKQLTIQAVSKALITKKLHLTTNQSFETFYKTLSTIKGIGDWTIHDVAMRALGMKDCFPASDLGIIKALTQILGQKPHLKEIQALAEQWHPYRSYAALCLWNQYESKN
jgi:AraC family transcriptional regulator, regulatory protein of adaptative response / DNA-3-methyladenine glycosylase II